MPITTMVNSNLDDLAVANFRSYLKIPSVQPDVDYDECITFLQDLVKSIDLQVQIFKYFPKKPILVATWIGQKPELPSILLNSHMDVVPVFKENWTYDPFGAEMDDKGNIYARGTQDMKSLGIQYLEAIRKLKLKDVKLNRTVHVSFVPDEEIGGVEGMKAFVASNDFKKLNVGFALDEGYACPTELFYYFNGERCSCQMRIHCPGVTAHGAILCENTAGEKVRQVMDKLYDFRLGELKKLQENSQYALGDVTTINVTMLEGGVQQNVVPPEFSIVVDCRVAVTLSMEKFESMINQWCKEAGEDVTVEFLQKDVHRPLTKADKTNPYWVAFESVAKELNIKFERHIMPGGTDVRYLREVGIPALGFSPMNNTPTLLHGNDEYLNAKVFLRGIDIYCAIITKVGNV